MSTSAAMLLSAGWRCAHRHRGSAMRGSGLRRRGRVGEHGRDVAPEEAAEAQASRAVEMIFVGEKLGTLERHVRARRNETCAVGLRDLDQRTAGNLGRFAMCGPCRNAHEKDRNAGGFVARRDRLDPLHAVAGVRWARFGNREHLRCDCGAFVVRDAGWIEHRAVRKIDVQAGERLRSRMRRERVVRGSSARLRERCEPCRRIRDEILKIVAQLGAPPKEIDAVLDTLARIGERARELGKVAQLRLKDDVAQIHRSIVAVEAADGAIVVGVGIDRDHDGPQPVCLRIDCPHEERPAPRRGAGDAAVEETEGSARGTRHARVEARIDARVAQD